MEIKIEPKRLAVTLLWIVSVLTAINCAVLFLYLYLEDDDVFGLIDLFDFDIEGNIPTFYSAAAILLATGLLALITRANWRRENGHRFYWQLLTCMFFFLALDEAAAIHETIGSFFERFMDASGFLYFMWVVPYGIATAALGAFFLKFVLTLPAKTRNQFIVAGAMFVGGAIGLEMLGAREADVYGTDTIVYSLLYTFEELFEMLGIVLFIYALSCYLTKEFGPVRLVLGFSGDVADASRTRTETDGT